MSISFANVSRTSPLGGAETDITKEAECSAFELDQARMQLLTPSKILSGRSEKSLLVEESIFRA